VILPEFSIRSHYRIFLLLLTLLILILSCNRQQNMRERAQQIAQDAQPEPAGEVFVFDCAPDYRFTVQVDSSSAWLYLPADTVVLEQTVSASGVKYENDQYLLWNKGDSALLETGEATYTDCALNHSESIWQAAALRGTDFRAVGNEPGWHLELEYGAQLLLVTDYGRESYSFLTPEIHKPARYPVTYELEAGGNQLQIFISDEQCTDTMSGEKFPFSVRVEFNDQILIGCGRALP
jgi:membrane-bound inhibitor of C-type lysozyme